MVKIIDLNKKLPTVWIRNKKTGVRRKINAVDYASDLGQHKYKDWERVTTETRPDNSDQEKVDGSQIGVPHPITKEELDSSEQQSNKVSDRAKQGSGRKKKADAEVFDKEER